VAVIDRTRDDPGLGDGLARAGSPDDERVRTALPAQRDAHELSSLVAPDRQAAGGQHRRALA